MLIVGVFVIVDTYFDDSSLKTPANSLQSGFHVA